MERSDPVEQLLTRVSFSRAKGQLQEARLLLEEAAKLAPERADVKEILGDVYRELGLLDEALDCYKQARDRDPLRSSAEEKMAQVLLEIDRQRATPEVPFAPKSPALAVALSALFPGAGQVYNEQWLKGSVIAAGSLPSLYYFLQRYGTILEAQTTGAAFEIPTSELLLTVLSGLVALVLWTYGIVDAYRTARSIKELQKRSESAQTDSKPE